MLKYLLIPLCCYTLAVPQLHAQTTKTPSKKELRKAKRLEEAKKKPDYDPGILGHAYFGSEEWLPGTIWYEGVALERTPLRYDLVRDEVTLPPVEPDAPALKLRLISEKVDSFKILEHTFVRLNEQDGLPAGFYERLHDGKTKVFARREKYIFKETTYQRVAERFLTENRYYLYKNKQYHPVKNQKGVLKVLKDRKKALENFIHKENLDFRNNFEQALLQVVAYYDSLRE
ncbi:hypothetical protein [Botryobacter ruber]|uniref:hypothetical protein n=1 Tax=Botryobacter ruber TaxID=2171629 RepID=UPI000E0A854D|nr:hypothetical protein [Botryobacter ruber]